MPGRLLISRGTAMRGDVKQLLVGRPEKVGQLGKKPTTLAKIQFQEGYDRNFCLGLIIEGSKNTI
jgi:hypothetical protein